MPIAAVNELELAIVLVLFAFVTFVGFAAVRWRRAASLQDIDEWGLGGRKFGGWVTWFLLGGDIYTAYTFVAVPALVFGLGAIGFFAVPYTIVVYPLVLLAAIRIWSVAHRHGMATPADFVRARHGSSTLALAVLHRPAADRRRDHPPDSAADLLGLWRTLVHRWALLAGWAVGLISGLWMLYDTPNPTTGQEHFGGAQYALSKLPGFGDTEVTVYTGIIALAANLIVVVVGSLVLKALKVPAGQDTTQPEDYEVDWGEFGLEPVPATPEQDPARKPEPVGR